MRDEVAARMLRVARYLHVSRPRHPGHSRETLAGSMMDSVGVLVGFNSPAELCRHSAPSGAVAASHVVCGLTSL